MSKVKLAALGMTAVIGLVAGFEGLRNYAYKDAVGIPTICYGYTHQVMLGQYKPTAECERLLQYEIEAAYIGLRSCVDVKLTPGERIAYTSLVYNIGASKFCDSTIVKKLHSGDRVGACQELPKWVYAKGQRLPGLVKRRDAELKHCLSQLQ